MTDTPEFSRPVQIDHVGPAWQSHAVEAGPAERAALAARFSLVELPALTAEVKLRRVRAGRYIEAALHLTAAVVQSCVVTLEPVAAAIDQSGRELYGPIGGGPAAPEEVLVDPDSPEPLEGPSLDLGEVVAQHLALALDPYPRAPGAAAPGEAAAEAAARPSPFAGLAALKGGRSEP
jgi:uncharacterized metal-binding protein YceD (DUF177 family)